MEKSASNPSRAIEKTAVTENSSAEEFPVISIQEEVIIVDKRYGNEGSMALNQLVNGEFNSNDEDDADYVPTEREIQSAIKAAEEMQKQYNIISDEWNKKYDEDHAMDTHNSNSKPMKRSIPIITEYSSDGSDGEPILKKRKISAKKMPKAKPKPKPKKLPVRRSTRKRMQNP